MIAWSSVFETGVESVDRDHRRLVEGLNELEAAVANGSGSLQVAKTLEFLAGYAAEHFRREEGCMARLNCPAARANASAHKDFLRRIERARLQIGGSAASGALVARQVHQELCDWFVRHILSLDSTLRHCVPVKAPRLGEASGARGGK